MPVFEWQCHECGVRFEAFADRKVRESPRPCPNCKADAQPVVPTGVTSSFKKEVTGPGPQNTGIHDLDTKIDQVIGRHADQSREIILQRVSDKKQLIAAAGADGHDLSRNQDGTYRVMSPEERAIHERSQAIHGKAMDWRAEAKRRSSGSSSR